MHRQIFPAAYSVIAVNFAVFVICAFAKRDAAYALALDAGAVWNGQWWRLFTSLFIHWNFRHFLFNAVSLYIFGTRLEAALGGVRFTTVYFISGLAGGLAQLSAGGGVAAGASGAVFGCCAALVVFCYRKKAVVMGVDYKIAAAMTAASFILGFTAGGTANAAHFGGILAGLAAGFALSGQKRNNPR
jgi:rhomboid protease GluP